MDVIDLPAKTAAAGGPYALAVAINPSFDSREAEVISVALAKPATRQVGQNKGIEITLTIGY